MLVLLPGMDGTGTLFQPLLQQLPDTSAVTIVEYPQDPDVTYEQLEAHVIEMLPKGKPFTVIAESFSGPIALRLASRGNANLRAVVLVCSFACRPLGWARVLITQLPLELLVRLRVPDSFFRQFLVGHDASNELISMTRAAISSVKPNVLAARLRLALAANYCARRLECTARVIALIGNADRLLGRRALMSIVSACPTAEVRAINAPHLALQSTPRQVVETLSELGVFRTLGVDA